METMQAEYIKQNYVMSNMVSCDRTGGEIPAGIFSQMRCVSGRGVFAVLPIAVSST